jgi:hypothetical protein
MPSCFGYVSMAQEPILKVQILKKNIILNANETAFQDLRFVWK